MDPGVPMPAPIGTQPEGVRANSLLISVNGMQASLSYALKNAGEKPVQAGLSVYSPLFMWEGTDATYPDKSFPELRVQSGAKQLLIESHVDAYHGGKSVNDKLAQSQLDPLLIVKGADALLSVDRKSARRFRGLVKDGIVSLDDKTLTPNWLLLVSRSWVIDVPAHGSVDMRIDYELKPAFEPISTKDPKLEALLRGNCASVEQVKAAFKMMKLQWPDYGVVQQYRIPVQLGSMAMPPYLTVDFVQEQSWAGLTPRVSVVCQDDGTAAIGTPFLKNIKLRMPGKPLSVLVFLPQ
jgi:hypothetical protein